MWMPKLCKEKTGEGAKEICDHNFIKDNGKRLEVQAIFPPAQHTGPETECSGASVRMWCEVK